MAKFELDEDDVDLINDFDLKDGRLGKLTNLLESKQFDFQIFEDKKQLIGMRDTITLYSETLQNFICATFSNNVQSTAGEAK